MDWLGAGVDGPLIVIRAVHFAATAVVAGSLIFRAVVAEPALRSTPLATTVIRSQILSTAWIGLAIAVASEVIWLQLQAASMSGRTFREAMSTDVLLTVLNETQFGLVSKIRFVLAIILAACLAYDQLALLRWLALGSALGFIAAIAWTGHAGASRGQRGNLHLAADALHLFAAACWTARVVPLLIFISTTGCRQAFAWAA